MLKLYGANLSVPVIKVQLCINVLGIEHECIRVRPGSDTQTDEYLAMHPAGKVPAINDDGFLMFESNAIMKYLCRKHRSDLYLDDLHSQAKVDQWIDFVSVHIGSAFGRVLFNKVFADLFDREKDERSMQDGYNFINRFMPIIDAQLGKSAYLASDQMTIADLILLATLDPSEVIDIDIGAYSHIQPWREQLRQQSFYHDIHSSYGQTLEEFKKILQRNAND